MREVLRVRVRVRVRSQKDILTNEGTGGSQHRDTPASEIWKFFTPYTRVIHPDSQRYPLVLRPHTPRRQTKRFRPLTRV